jgi:hypothetical protein
MALWNISKPTCSSSSFKSFQPLHITILKYYIFAIQVYLWAYLGLYWTLEDYMVDIDYRE